MLAVLIATGVIGGVEDSLVTIEQVKADLRVLSNDMDADISLKMSMASHIVTDYIKRSDHGWTPATSPFLIKAAVLLVIRSLFNDDKSDPLSEPVKAILHRFRDPTYA